MTRGTHTQRAIFPPRTHVSISLSLSFGVSSRGSKRGGMIKDGFVFVHYRCDFVVTVVTFYGDPRQVKERERRLLKISPTASQLSD